MKKILVTVLLCPDYVLTRAKDGLEKIGYDDATTHQLGCKEFLTPLRGCTAAAWRQGEKQPMLKMLPHTSCWLAYACVHYHTQIFMPAYSPQCLMRSRPGRRDNSIHRVRGQWDRDNANHGEGTKGQGLGIDQRDNKITWPHYSE